MKKQFFWSIVSKFNKLMRDAIDGPDCTNPDLCRGNCCSIKIDVPKILAQEYIKRSHALHSDFTRSNIFSFHLRFDENTGKCFLFDREKNGCKVHFSGIKPPQCWIYPTNFANKKIEIKCKKLSGWIIKDQQKALEAEKLLDYYIFLCKLEAKREIKLIKSRILTNRDKLFNLIKGYRPSGIGGFTDKWDFIDILSSEGYSLQLKKFCIQYNESCKYLPDYFLNCEKVCDNIANYLINFLLKHISEVLKNRELDYDGKIPLYKVLRYL